MLSEEKIKIMTSLAMFEKHQGKRIFPVNRYFKSDYISSGLFRSFFSYTLSFMLCLVLWGLYSMEWLLNTVDLRILYGAGVQIVKVYGGGLAVYMLISIFVYSKKYEYAKRGIKVYLAKLKRLDKRYEGSNRPAPRNKGGRIS